MLNLRYYVVLGIVKIILFNLLIVKVQGNNREMDPEFYNLYYSVNSFHKSVSDNLEKINEELLQVVNDRSRGRSRNFKVSVAMLDLLESYIKINFLSENALKKLKVKLNALYHYEPERERLNFNPFVQTLQPSAISKPASVEVGEESDDASIVNRSISDTETSADLASESDMQEESAVELQLPEELPGSPKTPPVLGSKEENEQELSLDFKDNQDKEEEDGIVKYESDEQSKETFRQVKYKTLEEVQTDEEVVPRTVKHEIAEPDYTVQSKLFNRSNQEILEEAEKSHKETLGQPLEPKCVPVADTPKIDEKPIKLEDDVLRENQVCRFCYIDSPWEFYVRTNQELFECMETRINDDLNTQYQHVTSSFESKEQAKSLVGNFPLIYLESKRQWCRTEVLDWMDNHLTEVLVQLVDYGEKWLMNYNNLKCTPRLYSQIPKMAIRCHLATLFPPQDMLVWPQKSKDALHKLTHSEFVVTYSDKEENSYAVDLQQKGKHKSVSEILIENNLATQYKQEKQLEIMFEGQGEEKYEDDSSSEKTFAINETLVPLIQLPQVGDQIQILITGYQTTCHFYAHIITNLGDSSIYNKEFEKLVENMNANNVVQSFIPFKSRPGAGEIILAKLDTLWHRARCIKKKNGGVIIFLVDFGVTITKKMEDIRQMKDDFLYLPFQAVECILDGVIERENTPLLKSCGFFKSAMKLRLFKAEVLGSQVPLRLRIFDDKDLDMSYVLKNFGLVQTSNTN